LSSKKTNDKKLDSAKKNKIEYDKIQVFNALIELSYKVNLTNPVNKSIIKSKTGKYYEIGFSCQNILEHLNNKTRYPLLKEIKKIKKAYDNGKIDRKTKNFRINKIKSKFHVYNDKRIQRILKDFTKIGLVNCNNKRYFLSNELFNKIGLLTPEYDSGSF